MAAATERIVVQATAQDKKAIAAKAKKLDLPVSELMRRGAFAYQSSDTDDELAALADAAKGAADRAGAAIDDALQVYWVTFDSRSRQQRLRCLDTPDAFPRRIALCVCTNRQHRAANSATHPGQVSHWRSCSVTDTGVPISDGSSVPTDSSAMRG